MSSRTRTVGMLTFVPSMDRYSARSLGAMRLCEQKPSGFEKTSPLSQKNSYAHLH